MPPCYGAFAPFLALLASAASGPFLATAVLLAVIIHRDRILPVLVDFLALTCSENIAVAAIVFATIILVAGTVMPFRFSDLPEELRYMVYQEYDTSTSINTTEEKISLPPFAFISRAIRAEFLSCYVGKRGITIDLAGFPERAITMQNLDRFHGLIEYAWEIRLKFFEENLNLVLTGACPVYGPHHINIIEYFRRALVGNTYVEFGSEISGDNDQRMALIVALAAGNYVVSHGPDSRPHITYGELKKLVALPDYHHRGWKGGLRLGEHRHMWVEDGIDSGRAADFWNPLEEKRSVEHGYLSNTELL